MTSVSQDSGSLRYTPASVSEWTTLLSGTGLAVPSSFWKCDEASGNLADSGSAGRTVTVTGTVAYRATATGWTRTGIRPASAATGIATVPDVSLNSGLLLQFFSIGTNAADRTLCLIGASTRESASLLSTGRLRASSSANTSDGARVQAGTMVVATRLNRTSGSLSVFTQDEKMAPTYAAPAASTSLYLFGGDTGAVDATLVYAAYWSGTSAEMSDAQVQTLLDALEGDMTTRQKMAAGSMSYKTVVAIEGCEHLLSDAPSAAVLSAWHGYDWTSVLGGLFVNIQNEQRIDRDSPFTSSGRCTIRVLDETRNDTLGSMIHKRLAGAETPITATIDRNDTTISVKATQDFASSGTVYIGNEAIAYTGKTATSFTGCTRGKYSPFECDRSGSGGLRFGNHHRKGQDINHVQMQPIVSQLPRVWIGKRVGVWLHTWDEVNQKLNHRREAQLAYAGRIVQIGDDANSFCTVIELEHITKDLQNSVLGRDQFKCTLADGMYVRAGMVFSFKEVLQGGSSTSANNLTVVSGTPASTNEMQAGYYRTGELCENLNRWIGGEIAAGRVFGTYSFASPVSSNVGLRTKCYWRRSAGAGTISKAWFYLQLPGEISAFLGIKGEPGAAQQTETWLGEGPTNEDNKTEGENVPYETLIFKPGHGSTIGQEFNLAIRYDCLDEQGAFINQFSLLPQSIKGSCVSTKQWGLFLLDERLIIVGSYSNGGGTSTGVIDNVWLAPFQLTGDNAPDAAMFAGRRADEPAQGPVTLRQLLVLEERWAVLLKTLLYSSGVSGYNHSTYDTLDYTLGVGMPGSLLGDAFERSIDNMPGAELPVVVIIDEPTKLSDLISGDLLLRRSFLRWKDEHFEICQWRTPLAANAIAALTEATKASADPNPNFRCSSVLSQEFARPTIKFDYCRDFAIGRGDNYQKAFGVEDQTQVDDLGGNVSLQTIKLRNTYANTASVGAGLDSLMHDYVAAMPMFRPSLTIERSLDQRYFFELAPGDIVTVTDSFARDPITGERGISERAAFVTSHSYSMGGFTPSGKDSQSGRIELAFLDVQRGEQFAPCAQVDETAANAGYNAASATLTCHANKFGTSGLAYVLSKRRVVVNQPADATYFDPGNKVLIVEIDPANPASPTFWEREVLSQTGNTITLTVALSAPAWDATKKYRIVPQTWTQVPTAQREWAYQADDADHMIQDNSAPFHYSASDEPATYHPNTTSTRGEYLPQMCYGDGRPYDVGHERALVDTINAYIDYKSAHQGAFLWRATPVADAVGATAFTYNTLFAGPIYLGMDMLSSRVGRTLTVAPFWRSSDGAASTLRVTIGRFKPRPAVGGALAYGGDNTYAYTDPRFTGDFSQTATWSTSSTTWLTDTDKTLDIAVKDVTTGMVWLVIEGTGNAQCRGLHKCIEGARVISTFPPSRTEGR